MTVRAAWLIVAIIAATLAGCGQAAGTFSPQGPCLADGRAAGAYPDLEALLPRVIGDRSSTIDSGRNCSDSALGTLVTHGVHDVEFAGATLDEGAGNGTVVALFKAGPDQPRLQSAWMQEFYTAGAVKGSKTDNTRTSHPVMDGAGEVFRLDTLNDLSQQTVVVLDGSDLIRIVIVATAVGPDASKAEHDKRVEAAVAAAAAIVEPSQSHAPCGCATPPAASTPAS